MGYLGVLTTSVPSDRHIFPHMIGNVRPQDMALLHDGDIISLADTGISNVLWESKTNQNSLMLTESCNCHCIMCPQPPAAHNQNMPITANRILDLLRGKFIENVSITGGEPTVVLDDLVKILKRCHKEHPETQISVLTNGKLFSKNEVLRELIGASDGRDIYCVSLHSDIPEIHDRIVGVEGSYDATQKGLYNLAKLRLTVEIRHVIMRENYSRLVEFAEHIYRYFPFCAHVAFMSMEFHGLAEENSGIISIDPLEYREELRRAVQALAKRRVMVSIYNTPLCLVHEDVWSYSRQSISSWKNVFTESCTTCQEQNNCCGLFSTSSFISNNIAPIIH